jgi:hypothetical protein
MKRDYFWRVTKWFLGMDGAWMAMAYPKRQRAIDKLIQI